MQRRVVVLIAALTIPLVTLACPRKSPTRADAGQGDGGDAAAAEPRDPRETELWERAEDGEADDLARLADRVGTDGLIETAANTAGTERQTALRALGFTADLSALSFLADVGTKGSDPDAQAALDSAAAIAAQPRRQVDPEYALELHAGCAELLALAKDEKRPRLRRVAAIRALRMLAERGCVKREEIPADLDAK